MLVNISIIFQIIIALGLLNVWIIRFNKETPYRGGVAKTMREEFAEYHLPNWSCYAVGTLKIVSSLFLIIGIWLPELIFIPSAIIVFLMGSAFTLHLMIRDPFKKSVPALSLLVLSCVVMVINFK
jgi:hypothetical protein